MPAHRENFTKSVLIRMNSKNFTVPHASKSFPVEPVSDHELSSDESFDANHRNQLQPHAGSGPLISRGLPDSKFVSTNLRVARHPFQYDAMMFRHVSASCGQSIPNLTACRGLRAP